MTSAEIEQRGRAMSQYCDRLRERGEIATVEENEDLPVLRVMWQCARAMERAR